MAGLSAASRDLRRGQREQSAEAAIYLGDPEPFKALWSRGDDISLFGAFGPCKKGWHQVSKTVDWVAGRYRDGAVTAEAQEVPSPEGREGGLAVSRWSRELCAGSIAAITRRPAGRRG